MDRSSPGAMHSTITDALRERAPVTESQRNCRRGVKIESFGMTELLANAVQSQIRFSLGFVCRIFPIEDITSLEIKSIVQES